MKKEKTEISARLPFAVSMFIFGTIGLLRRFIELPSGVIACFRGLLGCVLLLLLQRLRGKKPDTASIRRYLLPLLISGGMIGFNWMLLFEAYRYTSIAVATLCYYTAPVMLILVSPFVFHERLTARRLVCVALAACGMVLVSGVLDGGALPDDGLLVRLHDGGLDRGAARTERHGEIVADGCRRTRRHRLVERRRYTACILKRGIPEISRQSEEQQDQDISKPFQHSVRIAVYAVRRYGLLCRKKTLRTEKDAKRRILIT